MTMDEKRLARARNNAFSLLRMRPRSEHEIRERLRLKGYGSEIIENVMASLEKAGYIDDAKFAKFWIDSRMHLNPVGDTVLKQELRLRGVNDALIESALRAKNEAYDEYALAFDMARTRFERLKKLDRAKAMKRLYDFLMRRGFKYETVQKIIENI